MSLSSSDWLQLVLFLAAVMIGVITSWIFFRAQQKTDFNRLEKSINRLESVLGLLGERIKSSTDVKEAINDLYDVKLSIDTINSHMSYSVRNILMEFRKQHATTIQQIIERFDSIAVHQSISIGQELREEIKSSLVKHFGPNFPPGQLEASIDDAVRKSLSGIYDEIAQTTNHLANQQLELFLCNFDKSLLNIVSTLEVRNRELLSSIQNTVDQRLNELTKDERNREDL